MKAREVIYYVVSSVISCVIHNRCMIKFFSLFTFQTAGQKLIDPGIKRWFRSTGMSVALLAFFLLFLVNLVWSAIDGRLFWDSSSKTYNFFEDWPNLVNYIVLCPLYATLGLCFLLHMCDLRNSLQKVGLFNAIGIEKPDEGHTATKYVLAAGLVLLTSILSISFYTSELPKYSYLFWFQMISPGGEKILSAHGYYYLVTNLILNLIIVAVIAVHLEIFALASLIGKGLKKSLVHREYINSALLSKSGLLRLFTPFTSIYVMSKALIIVMLVNMYTWKAQQPNFIGMLDLSIVLLSLLGVAL